MDIYVKKGTRVRAEWFQAKTASLAGMQMKFDAKHRVVEGVITHFWGNHPTKPTEVSIAIQPDEGDEVEVKPEHIKAVLTDEGWKVGAWSFG